MSKEAMKLKTAAEKVVELCGERPLSLGKWFIDMSEACESLREALAEQPAQQQGCEFCTHHLYAGTKCKNCKREQPAQQGSTCNNTLRAQDKAYPRTCKKCGLGPCVELANTALDKMAENARKLGLDYEPVWGGGLTNKDYEDAMRQRRLQQLTSPPAQQEPLDSTQISKVWWDGEKLMAKPIPFVEFYKPAQQEPVAWMFSDKEGTEFFEQLEDWEGKWTPLYTSPPAQRTWVGLTEDEVFAVSNTMPYGDRFNFAEAIEAKLKEKNT